MTEKNLNLDLDMNFDLGEELGEVEGQEIDGGTGKFWTCSSPTHTYSSYCVYIPTTSRC